MFERQLKAFKDCGIDDRDIYIDKKSGKDFEREQYQLLKNILREDDLLVIQSIDRLGKNYEMMVNEWKDITKNIEVDIVVLDMSLLDIRQKKYLLGTFINDLILGLLSYVAQTEREKIKTRQRQGIDIALANGVKFGRPKVERPDNYNEVIELWKNKKITAREAMKRLDLKPNTFYNMVNEDKRYIYLNKKIYLFSAYQ